MVPRETPPTQSLGKPGVLDRAAERSYLPSRGRSGLGVIACTISLLLASCDHRHVSGEATARAASPGAPKRVAADLLSQRHAEQRRAQVGRVAYEVFIDLTSDEELSGSVVVDFTLEQAGSPLTIDFSGGTVEGMSIDGRPVEADYNGFFVTVPGSHLSPGDNVIEIDFRHPYSSDGNGLHRFVDPEDGRAYLYAYLWPYYANRLFPCFDQPNLKASFTLTVTAPADWVVSSTTAEESVEVESAVDRGGGEGTSRVWRFPPSPPLSTYLYSLHAGPYRVWESEAGEIPLRLFARQSLAPHVDAETWFDYTRQGLDFYATYFDIPYPFGKYDQLIVPDFNIGAMENAAAVTFGERIVRRGERTRAQRESLAGIILHEMAHMWFGDLVTKEWWNGLWLNESFATYMSALAKVEATEFDDAWHSFYLGSKRSAYRADQLVTTHPIEVPVLDTGSFFTVFDSITYGKGASVLKQLAHLVGPESFRAGVSTYLKRHSYGNTELEDFTRAIGEAAGEDLTAWAEEWLHTAGVDTIAVEHRCEDGVIRELAIVQSPPRAYPILRRHRVELALYGGDHAATLQSTHGVTVSGEITDLPQLIGRPCPAIVFPNHEDWGYARVRLDEASTSALGEHLGAIGDPLARSMFWDSLWQMSRDAELSVTAFVELVLKVLGAEDDPRVTRQVLESLSRGLDYLHRMGPRGTDALADVGPRIETFLWRGATATPRGSDLAKIWFDSYVDNAHTGEALDRLARILAGESSIAGLEVDQDRRWDIVTQLSSWGYRQAVTLLATEIDRDPSYTGIRRALAAEAARPEEATKRYWLAVFHDPESEIPFSNQRSAMATLFPSHQAELQTELVPEVLEPLPEMSTERDHYFLNSYTASLLAASCETTAVEAMSAALADADRLNATVLRGLEESRQEAQRCLALVP